ncbi:MAG: hypothetical protein K6L81_15420 [Agarilytica sp.]
MDITQIHIIYFLVGIVLISIAMNVYWIVMGNKQEDTVDDTPDEVQSIEGIEAYIDTQILETKKFLNGKAPDGMPPLDTKVTALRTAYLNIEKKAYQQGVSSKPYWLLINDKLLKLLKVFLPQLFGRDTHIYELEKRVQLLKERIKVMGDNGDFKGKEKALKTLDGFLSRYRESTKDQGIIDRYMNKIERSVGKFEEPEYRSFYKQTREARKYAKSSMETLAKLNEKLSSQLDNVESLEGEVVRMKGACDEDPINEEAQRRYEEVKKELAAARKDNAELSEYVNQLKKRIIEYDKNVSDKENKFILSIQEGKVQEKSNELAEEVRDLSTEIATVTDREIDRLRGLLNRQRTSISSLDETVDDLRVKLKLTESELSTKDSEISALRHNLKESEMCIETLEQQVNELVERPDDEVEFSEDSFNQLSDELTKIKNELSDVINQKEMNDDLIAYFNEAVQADSMEDLASLLYQQLMDYSCEPSMEFHYGGKSIVVSKSGKIGRKDKLLIQNMQVNECDVGSEGHSIKFRMLNMYGVLRSGESPEKFQGSQKRIIATIKITDRLVEKIGATQLFKGHKKTIGDCQNRLKKAAFEIDKSLELQTSRTKTLVTASVGQLQDIARSAGLEHQKVDAFQDIEVEAIKELESDESLRLNTRKKFLSLIHELDNI